MPMKNSLFGGWAADASGPPTMYSGAFNNQFQQQNQRQLVPQQQRGVLGIPTLENSQHFQRNINAEQIQNQNFQVIHSFNHQQFAAQQNCLQQPFQIVGPPQGVPYPNYNNENPRYCFIQSDQQYQHGLDYGFQRINSQQQLLQSQLQAQRQYQGDSNMMSQNYQNINRDQGPQMIQNSQFRPTQLNGQEINTNINPQPYSSPLYGQIDPNFQTYKDMKSDVPQVAGFTNQKFTNQNPTIHLYEMQWAPQGEDKKAGGVRFQSLVNSGEDVKRIDSDQRKQLIHQEYTGRFPQSQSANDIQRLEQNKSRGKSMKGTSDLKEELKIEQYKARNMLSAINQPSNYQNFVYAAKNSADQSSYLARNNSSIKFAAAQSSLTGASIQDKGGDRLLVQENDIQQRILKVQEQQRRVEENRLQLIMQKAALKNLDQMIKVQRNFASKDREKKDKKLRFYKTRHSEDPYTDLFGDDEDDHAPHDLPIKEMQGPNSLTPLSVSPNNHVGTKRTDNLGYQRVISSKRSSRSYQRQGSHKSPAGSKVYFFEEEKGKEDENNKEENGDNAGGAVEKGNEEFTMQPLQQRKNSTYLSRFKKKMTEFASFGLRNTILVESPNHGNKEVAPPANDNLSQSIQPPQPVSPAVQGGQFLGGSGTFTLENENYKKRLDEVKRLQIELGIISPNPDGNINQMNIHDLNALSIQKGKKAHSSSGTESPRGELKKGATQDAIQPQQTLVKMDSKEITPEEQEKLTADYMKAAYMRNQGKKLVKPYIIYPESKFHKAWDVFLTILIIMTCLFTPYSMAFPESYNDKMFIFDLVMNSLFFVEICMSFVTAYYNQNFELVDDVKRIAINYLKSWFIVDFISTLPMDLIFEYGNMSKIVRFSKIGKIYKLIRVTKMIRLLQTAKLRNKFAMYMVKILKIGIGLERLLSILLSFMILQHVTACIWVFIGRFNYEDSDLNWIVKNDFQDDDDYDLYISALYFTVTTIVTVGYGDISPNNSTEKQFCILLMLIGVMSFSFTTGALSSLIATIDSKESQLKEKMSVLHDIQKEFKVDHDLFNELSRTVQYNHRKKSKDVMCFMEELPHKLKLELAMVIHMQLYSEVKFFKKKERSFIAWITTLLRPLNVEDERYVYKEGEEVTEIYFLVKGAVGYVLPRFDNKAYYIIEKGEHFGHTDIASDRDFIDIDSGHARKAHVTLDVVRQFTVMAFCNCDLLQLSISDLFQMKLEFPKSFQDLFADTLEKLRLDLMLKIQVIRQSNFLQASQTKDKVQALKSKFAFNLLDGILRRMSQNNIMPFSALSSIKEEKSGKQQDSQMSQEESKLDETNKSIISKQDNRRRSKDPMNIGNSLSPRNIKSFVKSVFSPKSGLDDKKNESAAVEGISCMEEQEGSELPVNISGVVTQKSDNHPPINRMLSASTHLGGNRPGGQQKKMRPSFAGFAGLALSELKKQ